MGWNINLPRAEYYDARQVKPEVLVRLAREVADKPEVAIDTETDGLTLWRCIPYYFSLCWVGDHGKERRLTLHANCLPFFADVFKQLDKTWILANAKFDTHMLANVGHELQGRLVDTSVMHALLYEEQPHGLKHMAKTLLGWGWTDFGDTFGKIRSGYCACGATRAAHANDGFCKKTGCLQYRQITALDVLRRMEAQDLDKLVDYAANDAYGTWHVYLTLKRQLESEVTMSYLQGHKWLGITTMWDYFWKTEVPFTRALYNCERNGLRVNRKYLEELEPKILRQMDQLEREFVATAAAELEARGKQARRTNPNSGPQMCALYYDDLGYPPKTWTKGGKSGIRKPQLGEKDLQRFASDGSKSAAVLIELKQLGKQYSTYIKKMPGRLDGNDRVHMRLNQDIARTGRLSSSDPNMQNVTGGEKDRFKLRDAFIPDDGNVMVVADYGQLEMRLLAAAANEPRMIDIFKSGRDIHTGNVEMVFKIPYDEVERCRKLEKQVKSKELGEDALTPEVRRALRLRQYIKTIGFGLNYGMKENSLARRLNIEKSEAIELIENYMDAYPAVRQFFQEAVDIVQETGYAFTILGRRRHLPDINAADNMARFRAERQASNMPIQGTAADVCKMAMIAIDEDSELRNAWGYRMCLQVHDEIVGECPKDYAAEVMARKQEWMENPFPVPLNVPLVAEVGAGPSWGAAK